MDKRKVRKQDEIRIDWNIACAKALGCIKQYKSGHDPKWLDLAERHLVNASGLVREFIRCSGRISDPLDWLQIRGVDSSSRNGHRVLEHGNSALSD